MSRFIKKIGRSALLILAVFLIGVVGYVVIEKWSFLDAVYMTIITVSTIGYGETHPLSDGGRIFTIIYVLICVSTIAYTFSALIETVFSAEFVHQLRKQQMNKALEQLDNHIIVCGYGRVGYNAVEILRREHHGKIAIIEREVEVAQRIREQGLIVLQGDATTDEMLRQAKIERAWGLIVATSNDATNLFIVLSARSLNPSLTIVARASYAENESKMLRAGANRVIFPYHIGGQRMAHSLLHPQLTEFLDVLTLDSGLELWLEDIVVQESSALAGRTLEDADIRRRTGVTLLAVISGNQIVTPQPSTYFKAQDHLIVLGTREQLKTLVKMVSQEKMAE